MTTSRNSKRRRRRKQAVGGNIIPIRKGPYRGQRRIEYKDFQNQRRRPNTVFATEREAIAELERINAAKNRGEVLKPNFANATLDDVLDLAEAHYRRENEKGDVQFATHERQRSNINTLRRQFGGRKLTEFVTHKMKFVNTWLATWISPRTGEKYARGSQAHFKGLFTLAFNLAIKEGLMPEPNPVKWLEVGGAYAEEGKCLALETIEAMVRVASIVAEGEHTIDYSSRYVFCQLGLFVGVRPQEAAGLLWGSVDFVERVIWIRNKSQKVAKNTWAIVEGTKINKAGKKLGRHAVPMSPLLYAILSTHKQRLRDYGKPTGDNDPVLVTARSKSMTAAEINRHWKYLGRKAKQRGFPDVANYEPYDLRHTYLNLLLSIDVTIDMVCRYKLMGRATYETTAKYYEHETPRYRRLKLEIEALNVRHNLGLNLNTVEGLFDGLGYAFAHRWINAGIEIDPGPARPSRAQMLEAMGLLLPGSQSHPALPPLDTPIDLTARPAALPAPLHALDQVREQRAWAIQQRKAGTAKAKIAKALGRSTLTINEWLRDADVPNLKLGKLSTAQTQALKDRDRELQLRGFDQNERAKMLSVSVGRIVNWAYLRGAPVKHLRPSFRCEPFKERIIELKDVGKSDEAVAEQLALDYPNEETPVHSTIGYFLKKINYQRQRRGG